MEVLDISEAKNVSLEDHRSIQQQQQQQPESNNL